MFLSLDSLDSCAGRACKATNSRVPLVGSHDDGWGSRLQPKCPTQHGAERLFSSTSRQRSQGNVPTRSTGRAEIRKARSATAETRLSGLVKPLAKRQPLGTPSPQALARTEVNPPGTQANPETGPPKPPAPQGTLRPFAPLVTCFTFRRPGNLSWHAILRTVERACLVTI